MSEQKDNWKMTARFQKMLSDTNVFKLISIKHHPGQSSAPVGLDVSEGGLLAPCICCGLNHCREGYLVIYLRRCLLGPRRSEFFKLERKCTSSPVLTHLFSGYIISYQWAIHL